ncbi:hypothetical protein AB0J90_25090 [Micromonospora sp. NPDC049523]|uniref:hypothetical protein n=1 Tax=Micromonospora sp. NPDC049523 TaxID=3155921 RepID=UPI00343D4247
MAITDITPEDIENAAKNHDTAEQDLDAQRTGLDTTVNDLYSANSGALMQKLNEVQDAWSVDMRLILDKLVDCAEYLRVCKDELELLNQDQGASLT